MLKLLKILYIQWIAGYQAVIAEDVDGVSHVCRLFMTDDGKGYVRIGADRIGYLDNLKQNRGEFRKNKSSPTLVRWHLP